MALGGVLSLSLADKLASGVAEVLPEVMARWGDVKSKLMRAATQGSKRVAFAPA
jgi:hypothetical protein